LIIRSAISDPNATELTERRLHATFDVLLVQFYQKENSSRKITRDKICVGIKLDQKIITTMAPVALFHDKDMLLP